MPARMFNTLHGASSLRRRRAASGGDTGAHPCEICGGQLTAEPLQGCRLQTVLPREPCDGGGLGERLVGYGAPVGSVALERQQNGLTETPPAHSRGEAFDRTERDWLRQLDEASVEDEDVPMLRAVRSHVGRLCDVTDERAGGQSVGRHQS